MANHPLTRTRAPRRFLIWLAALIVATLAGATLAPPATAAGTGDDYPSYLKAGPIDSIIDPWNFYNRNCTSFAAWRLNQQAGRTTAPWAFTNNMTGPNGTAVHFGNAIEWRAAATSGGWSVNNTPAVGAVAWWGSSIGTLGHVAIVSAVNPDGSTNVEEYNWGSAGTFHTRTNVRAEAYLHIFDQGGGDRDGDGVSDATDRCPDQVGPSGTRGCPDLDGDLVADIDDSCPRYAGKGDPHGCQEAGSSSGSSDVNGDGIGDTVGIYSYPGMNPAFKMWLFAGRRDAASAGTVAQGAVSVPWQTDGSWDSAKARFVTGDFNGDSLSDVVGVYEYPGYNPSIKMHLFAGRRDAANPATTAQGAVTIPWQTDGSWSGLASRFVTGDFNGDGLTDLVGIYSYPGINPAFKMWLFAGRRDAATPGTMAQGPTSVPWQTDGSWDSAKARFVTGDFNGDSLSDVVGVYEYPGYNPSIKMHLFAGRRDAVSPSTPVQGPASVPWLTDGSWSGTQSRFLAGAGPAASASAPTRVDGCGSGKDTYTIPAVTGVEYLVAGTLKAPGSYPGTGTVTITARAKVGYVLTGTTTWTLSWTTTACTTTVTGNALSTPTWTVPKATLSWAATGAPAGTAVTYDVQSRAVTLSSTGARGYTPPTTWLTATTTTTGTLTGTAGTVYQIHARATDQYGTVGAWSSWKTVTMPTDDRATSFGYTGTWTTGTSTSYYGGTYKLTSTPGAKVTVTAWTDQVSVIGARSTTSGKATITIDGVVKATIDTYGATAAYRQTLATITVPYGEHTITVTNLATTGRPRLNLDALAFRR